MSQTAPKPTRTTVRRIAVGIAVVILLLILGDHIAPYLPAAEKWIQDQGVWAPVFYVTLVCLLTLVCFPMDVLFIAAGAIFGLWWGTLYLFIATMLSQIIVFTTSRLFVRHHVERWIERSPRMRIINRAIEHRGARLLFLIRMAPIPASPITYLVGASRMPFGKFVLATTGLLPVAWASMYFGYVAVEAASAAADPKHGFTTSDWWMVAGLVASIAGVAYIGHLARRALLEAEQTEAAENLDEMEP
ncbi:MAG: TVP38/TMEM64 family protein [Puniceicoccales bacterium]